MVYSRDPRTNRLDASANLFIVVICLLSTRTTGSDHDYTHGVRWGAVAQAYQLQYVAILGSELVDGPDILRNGESDCHMASAVRYILHDSRNNECRHTLHKSATLKILS